MATLRPFTPRTERAIGRTAELTAIRRALIDSTRATRILYLMGPGGIGKTRLLEEAARLAAEPSAPAVLHGDIMDLYHSELHSTEGMQDAIVEGLDPEKQRFEAFRAARARFNELRLRASPPESLRAEQRVLDATFLSDYNQLAQACRILLRFDTMELIQRESDPVLEACQIEQEEVEIGHWLLETLPRLNNTVILLAGRLPAPLRAELPARCAESAGLVFCELTELSGLTVEESLAYFSAIEDFDPRLRAVPTEMRRRIWDYTDGHPIRLSLVIDLLLNGRELADLFPPPGYAGPGSINKEEIEGRLVDELMRLPWPIQGVLRYLALARKGLDAELLHHLAADEWDQETCRRYLEQMRRFTVVKIRPGTDVVFMHDELYALLDRYVLREREQFQYTYEAIAAYYRAQLAANTAEERRTLKPALLYYELQSDPWQAFWRCYVQWDEEAVRAFDFDLDMRLRDELLRFLKAGRDDPWVAAGLPRDLVDRDAAARWVRRYLSRTEHTRAAEIGRRLLENDRPPFDSPEPLYRGALQTSYAEALIYTGVAPEVTLSLLGQAVTTLEGWQPASDDDPRIWWQQRVLGRAYNNRGYIHWQAGRNGAAIREFRQALWLLRKADVLDEAADTLTNLGFVYGRWGYRTKADAMLLDAIEIRERLGLDFARGLSLNALGLSCVHAGTPLRGYQLCSKALDIFTQLNQPRGIGLAHLAVGMAHRRRGEQWKAGTYSLAEASEFFREAIKHLEQAEQVFTHYVSEPFRLWELYSEWGSAYCDWAWLLQEQGPKAEAERVYDLAAEHLKKGVEIAQHYGFTLQLADSYDDLSQVYADRGAPEQEYMSWLEKALALVPNEYRLTRRGFRKLVDPVEGWWLVWGKYHLGCGVRAMKQAVEHEVTTDQDKDRLLDQAAEHYALAVAYFQQYSPEDRQLDETLKSIYRRLKTLRADRLARLRRQIAAYGRHYRVNLDQLLGLLDDTLGLEPS